MKTRMTTLLAATGMFAGVAHGAYTGLYFEEYSNAVFEQPPDSMTIRLYATFDNAMDQVTGLGGTAAEPWYLDAPGGTTFYQDETFGDDWAHNGALDFAFQYLHYDSYWTIGTDDSSAGAPLGIAFPGEQPTWSDTQWYADDGGVFRTPDDPLSFPVDGKVLIGQFTFVGDPEPIWTLGYVKIAVVSDGESYTFYERIGLIPAPGTLAALALAGVGCSRRRRR